MIDGNFIDSDGCSFKKDNNNFVNFKHDKVTITLSPESEEYKEIVLNTVKELLTKWNFTESK